MELDLVLQIDPNVGKMSKNINFSENLFSQGNDVGSNMYAVCMIK